MSMCILRLEDKTRKQTLIYRISTVILVRLQGSTWSSQCSRSDYLTRAHRQEAGNVARAARYRQSSAKFGKVRQSPAARGSRRAAASAGARRLALPTLGLRIDLTVYVEM